MRFLRIAQNKDYMDYKYIEQLLERYFKCETSLEEERILRTFFSQKDVPVTLLPYRDLFMYEQSGMEEAHLSSDFDERMLALIDDEPKHVKARTITMQSRLRPLYKAAAVVGVILSLGLAAQMPYQREALQDAQQFAASHTKDSITINTANSVAMADSSKIDSIKTSTLVR